PRDWHVHRTEQGDDAGSAGLAAAVVAVARLGGAPCRFEEPQTVVPPELWDAEAHQLGELADLEPILLAVHAADSASLTRVRVKPPSSPVPNLPGGHAAPADVPAQCSVAGLR